MLYDKNNSRTEDNIWALLRAKIEAAGQKNKAKLKKKKIAEERIDGNVSSNLSTLQVFVQNLVDSSSLLQVSCKCPPSL